MINISTYSDLKNYLRYNPIKICWYGPRASDMSDLDKIIKLQGIISCYDSDSLSKIPHLVYEKKGIRNKYSIDDLFFCLAKGERLSHYIKKNNIDTILPYDSYFELENFCMENNVRLLSSSNHIKDWLRDKTNIDQISSEIGLPVIPGTPGIIDDFEFDSLVKKYGLPLFLHFAEGAGGTGNRIVNTLKEFENVKIEQKGKKLNAKKYFEGKTCTIDICVTDSSVICGTLEEELIGAKPLNSNPTEYVGSSWFDNNYSYEIRKRISDIGVRLGKYARAKGFIGCFHPDFLIGSNDEIFLTELNMRFGGSLGAYTKIQISTNQIPIILIHALALLDTSIKFDEKIINEVNLNPLGYTLFVLKNNFGKKVKISHRYRSGVYKIDKEGFTFSGKVKFSHLVNQKEIFICGLPESNKDTLVGEGAYMFEVMTRFPITDSKSKLNKVGKDLVEKIYTQFIN